MDWLRFNSGNSGILESTWEYSGMTCGSYGNDLGMTWEDLGDSGRVRDMTGAIKTTIYQWPSCRIWDCSKVNHGG